MRLLLEICFRNVYYFFADACYRQWLWLVLRWSGKKRFETHGLNIGGFELVVADCLSMVWQFKEIFVDRSYAFNSKNDCPLILDCGANIGLSCLFFSKYYPNSRVIAFEPDAKIFSVLEKNLSSNNIKNVIALQKAVWIHNQTLSFESDGADGGTLAQLGAATGKNIQTVQCIRLKDVLEQEKQIDLLKIDIEGSEVEVLTDCVDFLYKVSHLFIEFHSYSQQTQHLGTIIATLEAHHFRYYIKHENNRKKPFINQKKDCEMDFQANIYAYKTDVE